ncbi:MAG: DUF2513 domain-containing protein, partial [Methylobacter sp.]
MKRDMDLIRKILLAVESGKQGMTVEDYDDDTLRYHQALVIDAGLAKGSVLASNRHPTEIPAAVHIKQLT